MQVTLYILDGALGGQRVPLEPRGTVVGRDPSPDIHVALHEPRVSGVHARLWRDDAGWWIEDLGSTNGTFVDGERILGPSPVLPGSVVVFGEGCSAVLDDPNPASALAHAAVLREVTDPLPPPTLPPHRGLTAPDAAVREAMDLLGSRLTDARAFVDALRAVADELAVAARAPEAEAARTAARLGRPGGPVAELVTDLDELLEGLQGAVRWLDDTLDDGPPSSA